MPLTNYNFEPILEDAFAAALSAADGLGGIRTTSSHGPEPDEALTLQAEVGSLASLFEASGDFAHYNATLQIEIKTPRAPDPGPVAGTFPHRHAELVARVRQAMGTALLANLASLLTGGSAPLTLEACRPAGTDRDIDEKSRTTTLSYEIPFSVDPTA